MNIAMAFAIPSFSDFSLGKEKGPMGLGPEREEEYRGIPPERRYILKIESIRPMGTGRPGKLQV